MTLSARSVVPASASVGAPGAIVSTTMDRVVCAETLPAASVAVTVTVSGPCSIAVMSADFRV